MQHGTTAGACRHVNVPASAQACSRVNVSASAIMMIVHYTYSGCMVVALADITLDSASSLPQQTPSSKVLSLSFVILHAAVVMRRRLSLSFSCMSRKGCAACQQYWPDRPCATRAAV